MAHITERELDNLCETLRAVDDVDEEFRRCRDLVEQFVDDLEQAASGNSP